MESLLAIGIGLVLRIVVDFTTDNDDRVGGVLVGLWEGVVLNHFVRRMPRSFDPYLGFGFRVFVDFLFTQSLSRLALVALWALVGMLLADVAPNVWRDSGLRHLYRQVRKDVRHVKRSVPRIRIENDLPSVRLFTKSRSTSSELSGSIRSDRAVPSRSPAPSPPPTPGPSRKPGRSPPGTFPNVSGWSETGTDVSNIRARVVTDPGPSPAIIPSREHAVYERIDITSQTETTQNTTITVTQTQNESVLLKTVVDTAVLGAPAASTSHEPIDDPSRHDPPVIPDDWVDIDHPTPIQLSEPTVPLQADPDSTSGPQVHPSTLAQSRPASVLDPPPVIDILPDIPDVDHASRPSRPPEQIPLPESRAGSVIGGVHDQPRPRNAIRDSLHSHVDRATSEIGVDSSRPLVPIVETQPTKSLLGSRSWSSLARSKITQSVNTDAPEPPPKETRGEPITQAKLDPSSVAQGLEPQICTPAQVDPPPSILTQPGEAPPLLLAAELASVQQEQPRTSKPDQTTAISADVDNSSAPPRGDGDKGDTAEPSKTSLLDLPSPTRTPPPPFTEFAGVPDDLAAGEGPAGEDPLTQGEAPTQLTEEQKAAEAKRMAFLSSQVRDLEATRADLQKKLDKKDGLTGNRANAIRSDLEDAEKSLKSIKARMEKKTFSEPPPDPQKTEVVLVNKTIADTQFAITSAILDALLTRSDAGPMTIQAVINRQKTLKGKAIETSEAIMALAKRHQLTTQVENTPGIINITF